MTDYLLKRLLLMIPTFIGITIIGFLIMRLAPGDPAELRASGGDIEQRAAERAVRFPDRPRALRGADVCQRQADERTA